LGENAHVLGVYAWKAKFPGAVFIETDTDRSAKTAVRDIKVIKSYDVLQMNRAFISEMFNPTDATGGTISVKEGTLNPYV
jgi:hypothetical protein